MKFLYTKPITNGWLVLWYSSRNPDEQHLPSFRYLKTSLFLAFGLNEDHDDLSASNFQVNNDLLNYFDFYVLLLFRLNFRMLLIPFLQSGKHLACLLVYLGIHIEVKASNQALFWLLIRIHHSLTPRRYFKFLILLVQY